MWKETVISLLFLSICSICFADVGVSGQIVDQEGKALGFTTISFFKSADSVFVAGESSDIDGNFKLSLPAGTYYGLIEFISFRTMYIPDFRVESGQIDLGVFEMISDNLELEEVVVSTDRNQMQLKLDKRVYNVESDIIARGGDAADILDNLPSVTVDVEGNVSLRGSENVRILINGKPSGLIGMGRSSGLASIQGSMIEKIEVITNPGAKYEAEGEAGVINIILKKKRKAGLNGSFNSHVGWPEQAGLGLNMNYRKNKFNFFTNVSSQVRSSPGFGENEQFILGQDGWYSFTSDRTMERTRKSVNLQFGTEYFLTDKASMTLSGLLRKSLNKNETVIDYVDFDVSGFKTGSSTRRDFEDERSDDVELQYNFTKNFEKKDQKLTVDLQFGNNDETEISDYDALDENQIKTLEQRSNNTQDQWTALFKTDYSHPFNEKEKIEFGLRWNHRNISNDYTVEEKEQLENWKILDGFDDELAYEESISAAYISYAKEVGKFSYQLGLRSEYSDISTELVLSGVKNPRDYIDFFPTAHLTYQQNDKNQFQASYTRRISRPRYWYLMPFLTFSDDRVRFQGNTALNPEYTDSYELGYLKYLDKGSILSTVYYRHRTGVVERVRILDEETGITNVFPFNLATEDAIGFELSANYDITKWWSFNSNSNLYYSERQGDYEGLSLYAKTVTFNNRTTFKFKLPQGIDLQSSINYRAPRKNTQGRSLSSYNWDLGASKDIMKKKGTLTFTFSDIFNTRFRRSIVDLPNLRAESRFQWRRGQAFRLNFTYRLNQKKKRQRGGMFGGDGEGGGF